MKRREFLKSGGVAAATFGLAGATAADKQSPVIGFATGTYGMKTMSTEEALRTIAKIGYDGVELALLPGWPTDPAKLSAADRRAVRALLADIGLALPSMLESLAITGAPPKRAQNLERLKLAVALGNDLSPSNPPVVETVIGGRTADWGSLKGPMADELHAWAKIADDSRTTICFKPHAAQAVQSPERAIWL